MATTSTAEIAGLVRKNAKDNARVVKSMAHTQYIILDESVINNEGFWQNEANEIYFTYSYWKAFFFFKVKQVV